MAPASASKVRLGEMNHRCVPTTNSSLKIGACQCHSQTLMNYTVTIPSSPPPPPPPSSSSSSSQWFCWLLSWLNPRNPCPPICGSTLNPWLHSSCSAQWPQLHQHRVRRKFLTSTKKIQLLSSTLVFPPAKTWRCMPPKSLRSSFTNITYLCYTVILLILPYSNHNLERLCW